MPSTWCRSPAIGSSAAFRSPPVRRCGYRLDRQASRRMSTRGSPRWSASIRDSRWAATAMRLTPEASGLPQARRVLRSWCSSRSVATTSGSPALLPPMHSLHQNGAWHALLQVVADYTRLSAVQAAGRPGHERASKPQYPGVGRCSGTYRPGGPTSPTSLRDPSDRPNNERLRETGQEGVHGDTS